MSLTDEERVLVNVANTEIEQRDTRIRQLERLNQSLSAEIDRRRPIVEAAQVLARSLRRHEPESWSGTEEALERAVTNYEQASQLKVGQ